MQRLSLGLIGVIVLSVFTACGDDVVTNTHDDLYKEPISPENVLFNLEESYRQEEIQEYAKLLAPEFVFKFQLADLILIEDDFWTRDQDIAGTSNLFSTLAVSEIRISLTHGPAEDPQEVGFDPDVQFIRINPAFLEVDEVVGTTWHVDGDIQDFFFRPGKEMLGENPDHWFIIEWRDIPDPSGASRTGSSLTAVETTTWGLIKTRYEPDSE